MRRPQPALGILGALVLAVAGGAWGGQARGGGPAFAAVSVRPSDNSGPSPHPFDFRVEPNRLTIVNLSLGAIIERAFGLMDYQLTGPKEALSSRYDIAATSGAPVSRAAMMQMLQRALGERFQLQTHWGTKAGPTLGLVVLSGGPRMKPAVGGYAAPNSPSGIGRCVLHFEGPMSMAQLAGELSAWGVKPVADETGLDGYFMVDLTFLRDGCTPAPEDNASAAPPAKALRALGLGLIAGPNRVSVLFVDRVSAPGPN